MKRPIILNSFGFMLWMRFSKSEAVKAFKEISDDGFFEADWIAGERGEVFAFDLTNGIFLHCQSQASRYTERCVTLVEYELYAGLHIKTDNPHTMLMDWMFHLKSIPLISLRKNRIAYNATNDFLTMLKTRNQSVIDMSRKSGYHQWREKMKRKGWLVDREVDNQIIAQRRGEQVLEIVPLEELEGTSDMQGR